MIKRERDSQRKKAYAAENAIFRAENGAIHSSTFESIGDCNRYIHAVLKRAVFVSRYGARACKPVDVIPGKGCCAEFGHTIRLAKWGYSEWMCLHELAHIIQYRINETALQRRNNQTEGSRWRELAWLRDPFAKDSMRPAGHGWQWASIYLDLVRFMIGKGTHDALRDSFKKHKVRFRPKIVRAPSTKQKEAFERFIAAKRKPSPEWVDPFESW